MLKLFLRKGAKINQVVFNGMTALHIAVRFNLMRIINLLLRYGADMNILDGKGKTALTCAKQESNGWILFREMSKLMAANKPVCKENLNFMHDGLFHRKYFNDCLAEAQVMKDYKLTDDFSMLDILDSGKRKKLITLITNEEFVENFWLGIKKTGKVKLIEVRFALKKNHRKKKIFEHHISDLERVFKEAKENGDIIESEYKKLYSVFKNHLPDLVIRKIAYFLNEDLYNEYGL